MKAKEFLKNYGYVKYHISRFTSDIEHYKSKIDEYKGHRDTDYYYLIKRGLTESEAQLKEAQRQKDLYEKLINRVENPKYRKLLYYRYIKFYTWEEITDILSEGRKNRYEEKNIEGYMKKQAYKAFQNILDTSTEKL